MSIETFLAALLADAGLKIPKKAPWCLWLRRPAGSSRSAYWENMSPGGLSARRCGKMAKTYRASGIPDVDMMILPKGGSPP